jgi:6-phosphogluconate dehydrogenase
MAVASQEFGWDLNLGELAMIWRGGCIIRARLLHRIREAYQADASAPNLLLHQFFREAVKQAEPSWRKMVALAVENGVPTPAFSSALAYYDGMRRARGPANLLQGLRDYFGAHTYARLDRPGKFHTQWAQDGTEVPVAAREK